MAPEKSLHGTEVAVQALLALGLADADYHQKWYHGFCAFC
jgi:hypothetical protein